MEFHPIADIFPMMSADEYTGLCDDFQRNGLHEAIKLFEGKIIDGRNRYNACCDVNVKPRYVMWDGNGSPIAYVVSLNLHRRHLDESQRAMIAARLKPMFEVEAKARMLAGKEPDPRANLPEGRARDHAAQMLNVSTTH